MDRIIQVLNSVVLSLLMLCSVATFASTDSTRVTLPSATAPVVKTEVYRTFESLQASLPVDNVYDPIIITNYVADSVLEKRAYAEALLNKVKDGQRFIGTLDALSEIELPIGIVKSGGSLDYSILIDRMTFTTKGAIMEVYVSLTLPKGGSLTFNGKVPLSKEGGIAGVARIFLVGDHPVKFGDKTLLNIVGNKNTYVEFDCNGFKGVSIEGEFQFSRELILPEDEKGETIDNERVTATFITYAQSLNDIMVGIKLPPFQVNGMKGFGFTISEAILDWSDNSNPSDIVFPKDYTSSFLDAGLPNLWQGFYLKYLEVRLPASFSKQKTDSKGNPIDGERIKIDVTNMILDDQGFTGGIFAQPVLELGDMSGWSYSIDKLGLEFVTNQVKGFEITGNLTIPVIKAKDDKPTKFGYLAQRGADGNYIFAVKIENELTFPLFVADLNLFKGSSVVVKEKNNKFYPTAMLNGELSIKAAKAVFNSLRFEGLKISSEEPHFDIQSIGFGKEGSTQSMSKYPLVINNIMLKKDGANRMGIGFDVTINIGGKPEEDGFGGTAALTVWGKQEIENVTLANGETSSAKQSNWKFDKVEVSGIGVNFKKAGVIEIAGMIRFFEDDPIYGDGFKGSVSGKIQVITLQVETLFGKTPDYRYWFGDAKVEFEQGLPLVSGISAYGFGGGFYYKMKQSTDGKGSVIGMTASGITYIPDENSLGIKAMVKFGCTGSQMPYNGDVTLEVALNTHGGINSVTFTGNVRILTPPPLVQAALVAKEMIAAAVSGKDGAMDKFMDPSQGQVSGHIKIFFDNENHIFHANTEIYVNVAGGIVKGIGEKNKAGWAVMHFERDDWYVLIGTPDDPVGLEILWMLKMRSYFMLGKHLPGSPPPPRQVSEILHINASDLDYMRDLNAIESGLGFAFGMNLSMDTGDLRFLMFYGRFSAGIGTDIMLKQYSKDYHCQGSDGPIGINGWYANGQAYAYIQGKIGIKVNLRFYKGDYDILSIGAAAVLQAKGPNPFWMRGIVGGYYKILGGLIKGNCKFEVTIGKDCKIVGNGSPLDDVKIIAQVSPAKNQNDVDVFTAPQVAFNIPVGKIFEITDIDDRKHVYRATLDEFSILNDKQILPGTLQWNDEADVVIFNGRDILPGETKLKAKAKLVFEERVNGAWATVKFDGQTVEELEENEFTTGKEPDYIASGNVSLSYPLAGQVNFYPKEYDKGFIQLKQGQPKLFKVGPEWNQKIRLTDISSKHFVDTDLSYAEGDKKINFIIPDGFSNATIYHLEVVNIPTQAMVVDANVKKIETAVGGGNADDSTAILTTKKIEGELESLELKSLYTSTFRTSKYNTFGEKMNNIHLGTTMRVDVDVNVFQLGAYITGDELFDAAEIYGIRDVDKLVEFEAMLGNNSWYNDFVYPLVYDGYPLLGWVNIIRRENPYQLGIPPSKDVYILTNANSDLVIDDDRFSIAPFEYYNLQTMRYNLMVSMASDHKDIQHQVVNFISYNPDSLTPRLNDLILKPFPLIRKGIYKIKIRYVIPGINEISNSYEWQLDNTVPD